MVSIIVHFGTNMVSILYYFMSLYIGGEENMLFPNFVTKAGVVRISVRLRRMLLMPLFLETGCGLKASSFKGRREKGVKRIKRGIQGKERGPYRNWNALLTSHPESI